MNSAVPPNSSSEEWTRRSMWQTVAADAERAIDWGREALSPVEESKDPDLDFMGTRRIVGAGRLIMLTFLVGFFGWAGLAPLDSAVMAPGVVVVESRVKTIQHLEGGIVHQILVNDGQRVHAGQMLLSLDSTQASSVLGSLLDENDALEAQEARLVAERDGRDTIAFPADLLKRASDPTVAAAMRGEENAFTARRETLAKQIDILNNKTGENGTIVAGLEAEQASVDKQIGLINRESQSVQSLYDKGLSTLPQLLTLKRQAADLTGQRGQLNEKIAQTKLTNGENDLQIMTLKNQQLSDVVKDLRDVQTKRFDLQDKVRAARDVLSRLEIRAPVSGRVQELSLHTIGAVVKPGEPLMEVVPEHDELEVDAHVRPEDADNVYAGMTARINFSAYQARRLPIVLGKVKSVSADRQVDQRTGQAYFAVAVTVDRAALKDYPSAKLIPGLPVDVALDTGSRTALEYFLEPITDTFQKGMKER